MSDIKDVGAQAEEHSRQVAEDAREKEWKHPSFVQELFMGRFRSDLVFPFPEQDPADKAVGDEFLDRIGTFLKENLDPDEVDRTGEYPQEVLDGLMELGAFGMKIPTEYQGQGLSQINYIRANTLISSYCASTAAYVSAHQSIGVPQPLKLFGTKEQKEKYLPQLATNALSAFALTEPGVGSDPAKMQTEAVPTEDGEHFILNGEKLWCTNGVKAKYMVVMAQTPLPGTDRKKISAFVVAGDAPGVEVVHRCQFMGLRGIANGVIHFTDVKVPKEDLIGELGDGLKIALITLNAGRLSLPAGAVGAVKKALQIGREWARTRVQWGQPIGKHEAVASLLANVAADAYGMEAMVLLSSALVDKGKADIRLEAAMSKLFCSERGWQDIDDVLQMRGGRGYEEAQSLAARGEAPVSLERMLRDSRINRIVEGTTQVMHLFLAREALDRHLQIAGDLVDPKAPTGRKVKAFFKASWEYTKWLPKLVFGWGRWPRFSEYGPLAGHVRFIERSCRKLAFRLFLNMARHQARLEKKQGVLTRAVEVGTELFAMAAACARAVGQEAQGGTGQHHQLADLFCRNARERVNAHLGGMLWNHDSVRYQVAQDVMKGRHLGLEDLLVEKELPSLEVGEVPATAAKPEPAELAAAE